MPPSSPSASPSSLTTSPHSPRSPTPSLSPSSFDTASSGGSEPTIPVYGRKTGVEGYIAEEGSGMRGDGSAASASGSSGEGSESEREVTPEEEERDKSERRKLSGRIEAERARVSEELRISVELHGEAHMKPLPAQATTSLDYPSINLGGAPHLPASQSLFAPIPLPKDGDLDAQRRADTVDEWRAALRDAHQVPVRPASEGSNSALATATTSTPKPAVTKPSLPVLVLPPPFPPTCKALSQQTTPVAHDFQPSFPPFSFPFSGSAASSPAASIVGDPFQLFHPDSTTGDLGKLPLPDAPGSGDYVFPDGRGRASFSSESTVGGRGGGRSKSRSRSRSCSPVPKDKATMLAPPALGHKASNPESLIDLYRRPDEDEGAEEKDEEEKRGRPCGMVVAARASDSGYSDEDGDGVGEVGEQERAVEGVDPDNRILLSLPPYIARLSHCPRCHRPFDLVPALSSSPTQIKQRETAQLQLWAKEHWNCVPWVAGGKGVKVVVGETSG